MQRPVHRSHETPYALVLRAVALLLPAMASVGGDEDPQGTRGDGEVVPKSIRGRGGRSYVSNAKLGFKRARRPFHIYLADMRGTMGTYTRRRITKKRPIFRFDLLKLKFDRLPPDARGQYDEKGLAAVP